jgi:hypothetical protein
MFVLCFGVALAMTGASGGLVGEEQKIRLFALFDGI